MRIALCLEFPIALRGGVSVLVETLLEDFVRHGHEVILVSADSPESFRASDASKLAAGHFTWDRLNISAAASKKLAGQLAGARVDVAHFHFGGNFGFGNRIPFRCPIYFLGKLGIPCVTTVHSLSGILEGYCGPQKPTWFKLLMFPLAWCGKVQQLRHTRREIAVSRTDLRKLRRWYWPMQNRFTQIYHSRLRDEAIKIESTRQPVILNVGHLAWRKGQAVLADAFMQIAARHPEWTLQLAGEDLDGTNAPQIMRLAEERGLAGRIQILGERNDTPDLMNRAAIYVQPSYWEGLPLALQEAMYRGCASVGSRIGAHEELIHDHVTGHLFEVGNPGQLAQVLENLIQNPPQREKCGAAASQAIRDLGMTATGMASRHIEMYDIIRNGK
jgi:glycosyltransferase involved in cell wall biosynthesis